MKKLIAAIAALVLIGCGDAPVSVLDGDAAVEMDGGLVADSGSNQSVDAGPDADSTIDAGHDSGTAVDAGSDAAMPVDAGSDASAIDAGSDAGPVVDAEMDAGAVDAGTDAGIADAGSDAGAVRYRLEIWGYHVPDQWYTAGWATGPFWWDPGQTGTNVLPDVMMASNDFDADTTTRTPGAAPRWTQSYGAGTWIVSDNDSTTGGADPGGRGYIATCTFTSSDVAAAKADGQLRTTTCYATDGALFSSSTQGGEDFVTVTWRVGTY